MLEQADIKLKGLNVDKLRAEYQALETQKKELTATYKIFEKEVRDLKRKQENLDRHLGRAQTDPVQEQQTKNKITVYKTIGENAIPSDSTLPLNQFCSSSSHSFSFFCNSFLSGKYNLYSFA